MVPAAGEMTAGLGEGGWERMGEKETGRWLQRKNGNEGGRKSRNGKEREREIGRG